MINVVHLTDSPFFGGPERQILGLSLNLPDHIRTTIVCFRDRGTCLPFVERLTDAGVATHMLEHANPRYRAMVGDVMRVLRSRRADLLVCHGYKADVIGLIAARRLSLPAVAVSRGWTAHTWKVRVNETIDRRALSFFDRVVCVSEGQAERVRRAGVSRERVRVIRNSIDPRRFSSVSSCDASIGRGFFHDAPDKIVLAVGRLSPEKGFDRLIDAAKLALDKRPDVGFLLVGDGPERPKLEERIAALGIGERFRLTGFRTDVDVLLRSADVVAQSSYTEGLPNVLLEACAAGVPVVATDVGGTREIIRHGENGYLVRSGDLRSLESRLLELLDSGERRVQMGDRGRQIVADAFTFARQSAEYEAVFVELLSAKGVSYTPTPAAERSSTAAAPTGARTPVLGSDSAVRV